MQLQFSGPCGFMPFRLLGIAFVLAGAPLCYSSACGQAPEGDDLENQHAEEKPEAKKRLAMLMQRAADVHPWSRRDADKVSLEGHVEPLFRLVDPTRNYPDGAIWAWPTKGRPEVVLTLSIMGSRQPPRWLYEFASFSDHAVGTSSPETRWSCMRPGWEPQTLTMAPAPASSDRERMRQMRELARRFSAVELLPPPMRFDLRLLPQPILRYADADASQLDGAIFAFCHGTNP